MGFPNMKGKHAKDSLYSPKEFMDYHRKKERCPKIKPPKSVIMCYDTRLINFIKRTHKTKRSKAFAGNLYTLPKTRNRIGITGNFGIGASMTSIVLETLIAMGVKRFISIGTAGTLQKHIKVGDLIVCERAIRDEGTSHHYLKHSKYAYASKKMVQKIKESLDKNKQKYVVGTSWTIDAPFRETISEAKQYQREGVATVEMEASALFAVAKYRGVDMGAIFAISDSLAELEWKPEFHSKKTKKGLEILFKAALDALLGC